MNPDNHHDLTGSPGTNKMSTLIKEVFGKIPDGSPVDLYTLANDRGIKIKITNYGGIIVSIVCPDRHGQPADIVLGYDSLGDYLHQKMYFGCIVGRYANRIANSRFCLNGREYELNSNEGRNHLHGGIEGFHKKIWQTRSIETQEGSGLEFSGVSTDGEEGYPGRLAITFCYILSHENELIIRYKATTDKPTIINLTQHSMFNLCGDMSQNILDHELMLNADRITPVGADLIPTGELRDVSGTPFDFRQPATIGARIKSDDVQLGYGNGYDHNWVLNNQGGSLILAARVTEPTSGRILTAYTTEPGIQVYTGNYLDGSRRGKGGVAYHQYAGFALEAQHFPDSPNRPEFPSTVLNTQDTYSQTTIYKFSTDI
ncbi:Aldose 1-epimerase (EC [Olavius algarvensis Delta 1 endosymbiont]|nr:Aldose 1-epimerase (EC [Olavius algarvensis Delta 1 endosymbiont]